MCSADTPVAFPIKVFADVRKCYCQRKKGNLSQFATDFDVLKLGFTQPAITCSKLTIETLEQGVKYVQS